MKRILPYLMLGLGFSALLFGRGQRDAGDTITDRNIPIGDVTDFTYTYENINFNAFYQRYRFYTEDGKYLFYHETRERPNQYGPATEADITASGTLELTAEEWASAMKLLKDGRVSKREDSAESGSSGPWTFLYWKNDKSRYQKFQFASYEGREAFETHCSALAQNG